LNCVYYVDKLKLKHTVTKRSLHKLENVRCFYTNADCLMNKVSELKLLAKKSDPTIIGISEIKPKKL